ncbi:hypothetical protein [Cellulosimicrobium sp. SH8]|uniref:hypothetical protein n=1 Tax=Cellulosimicrobium sp. SH8 TaxID=2952936 RepID=UPI0021F25480|nr:hypothetical protein [Cellulosimicrobium sp. SH8]
MSELPATGADLAAALASAPLTAPSFVDAARETAVRLAAHDTARQVDVVAGVVQGKGEPDERERAMRVVGSQGIGSAHEMAVQRAKTARTAPHTRDPKSINRRRPGLVDAEVGSNDADDPLTHLGRGLDRPTNAVATGHGAESCRGRRI